MGEAQAPRIAPGGLREIGPLNWAITTLGGLATGGRPANVFTTLARHRRLFRRWLWFAARLMPGGTLPRAETELLILRVAHNAGSAYEWSHHERIARQVGLSEEEVARVRHGPDAPGWSPRRAALLTAADQLHERRRIGGPLWTRLRSFLDDRELIELCMLVGHYEMLAMTLNSIQVAPDPIPARAPLAMRLLNRRRAD